MSCCILPFSVSLSPNKASMRASSSDILSLCPAAQLFRWAFGNPALLCTHLCRLASNLIFACLNPAQRPHTCFLILPPWILPTMRPVVAPVATKGSASCAWGGSLRQVSRAVFFTDVMNGLRKSTSTCTAINPLCQQPY